MLRALYAASLYDSTVVCCAFVWFDMEPAARQARSGLWTATDEESLGVQRRRGRHPNKPGLCYAQLLQKDHWKACQG